VKNARGCRPLAPSCPRFHPLASSRTFLPHCPPWSRQRGSLARAGLNAQHQAQVLYRCTAGAFAQVVQARNQYSLAVLLIGIHAQLQLLVSARVSAASFKSSVGGSTLTHCSGVLVRP
jgi:hypothetical protein